MKRDGIREAAWKSIPPRCRRLLARAAKVDESIASQEWTDIDARDRERLRAVAAQFRSLAVQIGDLAPNRIDESGPIEPKARRAWWRDLFGED